MKKLKLWLFKRGWINIHPDALIHPTAFVHRTAIIYGGVRIEENVQIGAHCIIGSVAEYPNERLKDVGSGLVLILENTILHGLNTVDAGKENSTVISADCTLMKSAHVGHDAYLGERVTLSCGAKIGGFTHVEHDSTIGLNATVHQKSYVQKGSMIGAGSFFKGKALNSFMVWVGSPARPIKQNTHLLDKLKFNENFNHDSDLPKG
jgi:UDP-N-acetylglucosamine acyltransferase